ncbi:hypothetical protein ISS07_03175 [Candidatus Woesearchaeota archaeon]|nr:hypothetical protein [Candidatus Woesearchaeota archaeon]
MEEKARDSKKDSIISSFNTLNNNEKVELLNSMVFSMALSLKEKTPSDSIPLSIFDNDKLSTFEALVKYLKEILHLRFVTIADILKRSDKTIWVTQKKARQKMPETFKVITSDINIPLTTFSDRTFTVFESLVLYLKDSGMTNHDIAVRLHRDDRTIWSVYDRAKKKKNG